MSSVDSSVTMLPASFAQELLWLIDRASPGNVAYNVPRTRRLLGPLNVAALRSAFDALVARHEILRTTYATHDGRSVQVIHEPRSVPFETVDLSSIAVDARDTEIGRIIRERTARPFDLANDVLLRVTLIRLTDDEHVLLFESHHIAFDGWSRDVVFRDLSELYVAATENREAQLPALPIQYADYAIWQQEQLEGERLDTLLSWWRTELGDADHVLHLPTDFPRPAVSRYEGTSSTRRLPADLTSALRGLGQRHSATPYMVVLAAYATVLHRYTGQSDVLVGSPVAGRTNAETESLIGYFANTNVRRARFTADPSFEQLVTQLRESVLNAFDHQEVPFEKLVLELEGRTNLGQSPLFQVVLTQLDNSQGSDARMGDITLLPFASDAGATKFDLTLFMSDKGDELELTLRGRTELHFAASIERLLGHIEVVLTAAAQDDGVPVSRLPLLSVAERAALSGWNMTRVDEGPSATVVSLFEQAVTTSPDRIAIMGQHVCANVEGFERGMQPMTYAVVNARANRLAHLLATQGVKQGSNVGLLLDRSNEAIVGMLGILKAGAAYVPLSLDAPATRIAAQLAECEAKTVVTGRAPSVAIPAGVTAIELDFDTPALRSQSDENPAINATPDDRAYVLFTSGSTGTPKGVSVSHANVVHYTRAISRVLADVPADASGDGLPAMASLNFGLVSTLAADLGNTSVFPSLLSGGTLHVFTRDLTTEPARFAEYVQQHPLDVLKITPNHLRALTASRTGAELAAVLPKKWIVTGGEALQPSFARLLLSANGPRVLNHYGPTETTVGVLTYEATRESLDSAEKLGAQIVPLGRPVANTQAFVVDAQLKELPVGIPGELLIGGAGVTAGYVNREDLSAERFVQFAGQRVYRTGDRARRLPNGVIEFLGRADNQVKVRGYRVELGEIEHALRSHAGVESALVMLREDVGGDPRLAAYVVAKQDGYAVAHSSRPNSERMMEWLTAHLPAYMVPSAVVMLNELPLTANGKVDTRKLPAPDTEDVTTIQFVPPETPIQIQLAQIWKDVLKKEQIGLHESFVDLGGHSLLAIRILGRISKAFGVRLSLRTLFDAPTVAQLAEIVDLEQQLAAVDALSNDATSG